MIKNFSELNVKIENLDFFLKCEVNATFPMVKEALFQFQKIIGSIEDQIKIEQEKIEADKKAAEQVPSQDDKPPEVVD
jgi:hypothetical protein